MILINLTMIFYTFVSVQLYVPSDPRSVEPVWPRGKALSPFLTGRMFVREPSWEYSANLAGS